MKRQILIIPLLALLLTFLQVAMGGGRSRDFCNMEVLENNERDLLLRPLKEGGKLAPDKEYTVLKSSVAGGELPYMVPGYHVRMVYHDDTPDGGSIDRVYRFYILDKDGEVITKDSVPVTCSFDSEEYSGVDLVKLSDAHTGSTVNITDLETIREITDFIRQVSGKNGASGRGYYEGSYGIAMYDSRVSRDSAVFSITFGDSDSFFYGLYMDGYPVRYELDGVGIQEVIRFFSQYER